MSATVRDTVFPIPVSMGESPLGQVGQIRPYTTHVLYAFEVPTFKVDEGDTLLLDTANMTVKVDSPGDAAFSGDLRTDIREVATEARGWSTDRP